MTELETMQRAKMYLDKLANGVNPLNDQPVPDEDCINQVRISRCLFYVSDILRKVIENGGIAAKSEKVKKGAFTISHDNLKKYPFSSAPIPVSEITRRINELIDPNSMKKLKYSSIVTFMLQSGLLAQMESIDGNIVRFPTAEGASLGISSEDRISQSGTYQVTVYNTEAQQFILDNIDAIIEINNQKQMKNGNDHELQGQPWTNNYDEVLVDLFQKNVPISEIAVTLKRTEGGIRARLIKLGLIENRSDAN